MNAKDFLKISIEKLKQNDAYKDIDMSDTSAFYNTVLLPFVLLMKPSQDLLDNNTNSLKLENMSESQLDDFATGYFISRRKQTISTIDVALYFKKVDVPVEPIVIYGTDDCRTDKNEIFNPVTDYVFAYGSLPEVAIGSSIFKVAHIIVSGSASNVSENSVKTTSFMHTQLDHITNDRASSSPINQETNAEFIKTLQNSIAERSNSKDDALAINLRKAFPYVTDVLPVGYGAPEMQRDIAVAAKAWSGHFGGAIDVYTRTTLAPASITVTGTKNQQGTGYYFTLRRYKGFDWGSLDTTAPLPQALTPWIKLSTEPLPAMPVLQFDWANTVVGAQIPITKDARDLFQYKVEVLPDPDEKSYGKNFRFSVYEYLRITVFTDTAVNPTETISLKYFTMFGAEDIQNYLNENADICSSTIVKSFLPIVIQRLVVVYDKSYSVDEGMWRTKLVSLVNAWNLEEPIRFTSLLKGFDAPVKISEVWDAADLPYTLGPNGIILQKIAANGKNPCFATMYADQIDGSQIYYLSTRQIAPITVAGLSATYKTCRYFISPENIEFVKGDW
jgi:hypothetical protein